MYVEGSVRIAGRGRGTECRGQTAWEGRDGAGRHNGLYGVGCLDGDFWRRDGDSLMGTSAATVCAGGRHAQGSGFGLDLESWLAR